MNWMNRSSSGRPHEVAPKQSSMYRPKSSGPSNFRPIRFLGQSRRNAQFFCRTQLSKLCRHRRSGTCPQHQPRNCPEAVRIQVRRQNPTDHHLSSQQSLSRRSITLINTQLIHQFVFRHADAVNLVLLRAGITLFQTGVPLLYH